jgi:hypothetical protein
MNDPFLIAIIALGLSVLASAVKLVDWLLHSDPRVLARTMRWLVIGLALLSVPLLIFLLVKEQWVAAAGLVAVMLFLPTLLGRGALPRLFGAFRPVLDDSAPVGARGGPAGGPAGGPDPDLVRRSAAVLEAYLGRSVEAAPKGNPALAAPGWRGEGSDLVEEGPSGFASGPMSEGEALEILGLDQGAEVWQISEAHRRLLRKLHPDHGGSAYLAIKVTQARDVLLRVASGQLRRLTTELARKSSR